MENFSLFNKIYGCLVGGSIGDAFGIRVEMMHYLDIKEQYGWVTHFDDLPPRKPSSQPPLELRIERFPSLLFFRVVPFLLGKGLEGTSAHHLPVRLEDLDVCLGNRSSCECTIPCVIDLPMSVRCLL